MIKNDGRSSCLRRPLHEPSGAVERSAAGIIEELRGGGDQDGKRESSLRRPPHEPSGAVERSAAGDGARDRGVGQDGSGSIVAAADTFEAECEDEAMTRKDVTLKSRVILNMQRKRGRLDPNDGFR